MALLEKLRPISRAGSAAELDLTRGALFTFGTKALSYVFVAIGGILLARLLGPSGRGVYSLVVAVALLYASFGDLGVSKAGIYLVGRGRYTLAQVTSNNLAWVIIVAIPWVVVMFTLWLVGWSQLGNLNPWYFWITVVGGVLALTALMSRDTLIGSGDVVGYNLVDFTEPVVRLGAFVVVLVLLGLGVTGAISAWLLTVAASAAVGFLLLARRTRLTIGLNLTLLREQIAFGIKNHMGWLFQSANNRLDVLVVGYIAGTAALGYYAVAFAISELLWQMPLAVGIVLFPIASSMDVRENAATAAATCRRTLMITSVATLGMLASARVLISLAYGNEFLTSLDALYILLPSGLAFTVYKILSASLAGQGLPQVTLYAGLISVPVTVALLFLLVPKLGIRGAAISSLVAYTLNAVVVLSYFVRKTGLTLSEVLLFNREDLMASWQTALRLLRRATA